MPTGEHEQRWTSAALGVLCEELNSINHLAFPRPACPVGDWGRWLDIPIDTTSSSREREICKSDSAEEGHHQTQNGISYNGNQKK